ncbi:MAG: glycosyltransferase [Gammaproteobacteria bacterium]|nr:glycosyltransferase [Gammaproteobacteria bacterium]
MKKQAFISFVIYTYNCENTVQTTIQKIDSFATEKFSHHEIIIVNDASSDNLQLKTQNINSNIKGNLTTINLARKAGLEVAMKIGVDCAIGDFVYEIDYSEISFPVDLLYTMLEKTAEGYDIVSLSPNNKTKASSGIFYRLFKSLSKNNISLNTEICRLLTRRAINAYSIIKNKTRYRKLLYKLTGYNNTTIYTDVDKVVSPLSLKEKIHIATDVLFGFTNIGATISLALSSLFIFISVGVGVYALWAHFFLNQVISGWTTLMAFLSFGFSGIFIILAIFNKYFYMILKEVRDNPESFIASIEKR